MQSVTAAQINSAISACPAGQTVFLNAGTYNLNTVVTFQGVNNVTLRGAGADQTLLVFSGNGSCGLLADICLWSGDYSDIDHVENTANWTGTTEGGPGVYPAGATNLTLSSALKLTVGSIILLDQLDDASDGFPGPGSIYVCAKVGVCVGQGGSHGRSGRAQVQAAQVTAVNGTTVTISPGLTMPNWRPSQSPQAWWPNTVTHDDGVENMSINAGTSSQCGTCANIVMFNVRNSWIKGVRSIEPNTNGGNPISAHIWQNYVVSSTVRDSYFYGSDNSSQSYGIEYQTVAGSLTENNIFQHVTAPLVEQGPNTGNVFGYNFALDDNYTAAGNAPNWMDPMSTWHEAGEAMNLYEGNQGLGVQTDNIHGTHHFGTYYRNHFVGDLWNSPTKTGNTMIVHLWKYSRFFNFVGNVLGRTGYYNDYTNNSNTSIFGVRGDSDGENGESSASDPFTASTLLRWGNWDTATNAARFCGDSSNTGFSTVCGSVSEVPSRLAFYANPVPTKGDTSIGQPPLPPSFYLSGQPAWWKFPSGTPAPFPAIGPDVTNGNVAGYGGHAFMIPAQNCWKNIMGGQVGTSGLLTFNANTCYPAGGAPGSPTNLRIIR